MRRFTLLWVGVLMVLSVSAQSLRIAPANFQLSHSAPSLEVPTGIDSRPAAPSNFEIGATLKSSITATKIGEAGNAFSSLGPDANQIVHVPSLNFMVAIYRNNNQICGGENGHYRYSFSTDLGATWNLAGGATPGGCFGFGFMNPSFQQACRFPNVATYVPDGATAASDINLVYAGYHHDGVGGNAFTAWTGSVVGVVNDPTNFINSATNVTQEDYPLLAGPDQGSANMVERINGEYWLPSSELSGPDEGRVNLWRGIYDETSNTTSWSIGASLDPPHFDTTDIQFTNPVIAFGPNGQHGAVAWLGDLTDGNGYEYGEDSLLRPVVSRTMDGGVTWSAPEEVPLGGFPRLRDSIESFWITTDPVTGDTFPAAGGLVTTGFNMDMTIDADGNPHIITMVGSGSPRNDNGTPGPAAGYSIFSGTRKFVYDFTIDIDGSWNGFHLGSVATFRGDLTDIAIDVYTKASRSEDGTKLFFSWTDTDTTGSFGSIDNLFPNLIGRALNTNTGLMTEEVNWSISDPNWTGAAFLPTSDPVALHDGGCNFTVPTMVSEFTDPLSTTGYWYWSDITYDTCADFTEPIFKLSNCATSNLAAVVNPTSPACGGTDGALEVAITGGVAPFEIEWNTGADTSEITGLTPGFYEVTVTDADGCVQNEEFILETVNAPDASITGVSNVSCFGFDDGSAAPVVTTGNGPFTFMWSNGSMDSVVTNLGPGTSTVQITDQAGCVSFETVTITEPPALSLLNVTDGSVDCFGDANGELTASAQGGSGTLSYSWDSGATGETLTGIPAGVYTVTITDENNCSVSGSGEVFEPAKLSPAISTVDVIEITPGNIFPGTIVTNFNDSIGNGQPFTYQITLLSANGNTDVVPFDTTFTDVNETSNTFGNLCAGEYLVTITDNNGCTFTDTAIVGVAAGATDPEALFCTVTVGINEIAGLTSFELFPNPTQGRIELSLETPTVTELEISVFNAQGQIVESRAAQGVRQYFTQFDLSGQAKGMYLVQVRTSEGVTAHSKDHASVALGC